MSSTERPRIDYRPGKAAQEALELAQAKFPNLRLQALLDKLVITGTSALLWVHWTPPALHGNDRDRWK